MPFSTHPNYAALWSILRRTKPTNALIAITVALIICATGLSLWVPLLTKAWLDNLSATQQFSWSALFGLAAALIGGGILSGVQYHQLGKLGNLQKRNLRNELFDHVVNLPIAFFDRTLSGEPANRIVKDTEIIEDLVSNQTASMLSGLLQLLGSFFILWFLDWRLTAVLFLAIVLSFLAILPFTAKLAAISKQQQDSEASLMANLTEWFAQIRLLRSATAHSQINQEVQCKVKQLFTLAMQEVRTVAMMSPLVNTAIMASIIAVLGFGATLVAKQQMTIGTFVAFIMFLLNIVFPVMQLSLFAAAFNKAAGAALRLAELFAEPKRHLGNLQLKIAGQDIQLHNLNFGYDNNAAVLKGLDMTLAAGKTTAIVALSGGGKSTLFALLQGFYQAKQGAIYIGTDNLAEADLDHYLAQTGYVAQDAPVLSGTLRDNLVLGLDALPSAEQLTSALNDADLYEFVSTLPQGLETFVGERGVTLSGGQRQRLALARCLLRKPNLLLLDEVTANLDALSETRIQHALAQAAQGRTTLIAAHRLSTILSADCIYVMEFGKIIGQGNHNALMQQLPQYKQLIDKQFRLEQQNSYDSLPVT
ncbi:ABC transporter ATP-binding protein [Pseudoalteromonas fenneropenaei]|uniref:ABC transporter ATP-binding protein n=1 Tax=Pseudoalteromonas fenneropenaei TaxID=1737459 RepID=A0ABV7CJ55_9GAMM